MKNYPALILLVMHGKTSDVKKALKPGANPNERDEDLRTALHWAAQEDFLKIVKCLIKFHADVNAKDSLGFTPLIIAAGNGNAPIVRELLKAGAAINARVRGNSDGTALHLACSWNHFEIVKILAESPGVDINARDQNGKTALSYAFDVGDEKLKSYLTQHGAKK